MLQSNNTSAVISPTCLILSKTKTINQNIWSKIKTHKLNDNFEKFTLEKLIENFEETQMDTQIEAHQGAGFFVKIDAVSYVITCNHVIKLREFETYAYANNINGISECSKLTLVRRIPELDIAVLKFANTSDCENFSFYTLDEFTTLEYMDTLNNNFVLNILLYSNFIENKIKTINLTVSNILIETEDFIGHIVPKIPLITFVHTENNDVELDNFPGFSGSVLTQNCAPLGMLVSFSATSGRLQAIPLCLVIKIVKIALSDINKTISGFNIPTKTVRADLDNCIDGKREFIGKCVCDFTNIKYLTTHKKFCFNIDDVIIKINNQEFNDDGTIFSSDIGYNVCADTFMMLECFANETNCCNFLIVRNENHVEKCINKNIIGKHFNTLYNTKIFNDHNYISWKGFIFAELSEELIENISNTFNFDIKGQYIESPKIIPKITSSDKKIVVVIDVDTKIIPKKYSQTFFVDETVQTPLIHTNVGKQLAILKKVGNKIISSIEDLELLNINKNIKSITLVYENGDNFVECV